MEKYIIILMAVGVALAYPAEDKVRPPNAVGSPQVSAETPIVPVPEQGPEAVAPEQAPVPEEGKPEGSDLKTDSSFWWGGTYFPYPGPVVYSRYYYGPRAYGYYPYYTYYW